MQLVHTLPPGVARASEGENEESGLVNATHKMSVEQSIYLHQLRCAFMKQMRPFGNNLDDFNIVVAILGTTFLLCTSPWIQASAN